MALPWNPPGQAVFAPLRLRFVSVGSKPASTGCCEPSQNLRPLDVMRPGPGLQNFVLFYRQRRKTKKYNIRRIILCQKMEKDVQEIHIHSHRWITMQISATQTILPTLQLWIIMPISVIQTTIHLNAKDIKVHREELIKGIANFAIPRSFNFEIKP